MTRKEDDDGEAGKTNEKMLALLRQSSAQVAGMTAGGAGVTKG